MTSTTAIVPLAPSLKVEVAYDANRQPETMRVTVGDQVVTMSAGEWSRIIARPFHMSPRAA